MTIFSSKFPYPVPFFCETYNDSIHIKKRSPIFFITLFSNSQCRYHSILTHYLKNNFKI